MNFRTGFLCLGLTVVVAACEPTVAERGNMVDPDKLAQIKPGLSKEQVARLLGSPTSIGTFDENYWYYIGQRTEQESFFLPDVTDRRIVEIDFDDSDKVTEVKRSGLQNAESVDPAEQETPPQGRETSLAEELFGKGGFGSDKNKKKKSDTGSGS